MDFKTMWNLAKNTRGQSGATGAVIGVVIAVVVIVAVAIPVTSTIITNANLTGTTKTVVELIPLFLGLAGLVVAASLFA